MQPLRIVVRPTRALTVGAATFKVEIRPCRTRGFEMWRAVLLLDGRAAAELTRWSEAQVRTDLTRIAARAGIQLQLQEV
jgi:hypothetical protein